VVEDRIDRKGRMAKKLRTSHRPM